MGIITVSLVGDRISIASKYLVELGLSVEDVRRLGGRSYKKSMDCRIPGRAFWREIEQRNIRSTVLSKKKDDAIEWILYPPADVVGSEESSIFQSIESSTVAQTIIPVVFEPHHNDAPHIGVLDVTPTTTVDILTPIITVDTGTQTAFSDHPPYSFDKPDSMAQLAENMFVYH